MKNLKDVLVAARDHGTYLEYVAKQKDKDLRNYYYIRGVRTLNQHKPSQATLRLIGDWRENPNWYEIKICYKALGYIGMEYSL